MGVIGSSRTCGVAMKTPILLVALAALGVAAQAALAFQEGTPGGSSDKPAAEVQAVEAPKGGDPGKGLSLKTPELSLGQGTGHGGAHSRVRQGGRACRSSISGFELLYGATEQKGCAGQAGA